MSYIAYCDPAYPFKNSPIVKRARVRLATARARYVGSDSRFVHERLEYIGKVVHHLAEAEAQLQALPHAKDNPFVSQITGISITTVDDLFRLNDTLVGVDAVVLAANFWTLGSDDPFPLEEKLSKNLPEPPTESVEPTAAASTAASDSAAADSPKSPAEDNVRFDPVTLLLCVIFIPAILIGDFLDFLVRRSSQSSVLLFG
jgi:hypothetical protein